MGSQKEKPMPDLHFRFMSLGYWWRDRFKDRRRVLGKVSIREGQTVLDFGCGPGSYTIPAARIVGEKGRVYALDIQPLAVKAVEKKARKERLANIMTILSDRDTGLPEESIDVVMLYDTIHLVKDTGALLVELHRVLKPEGLLSVSDHHLKVERVSEIVEKDGLFSLKEQHGGLLNFERRQQ